MHDSTESLFRQDACASGSRPRVWSFPREEKRKRPEGCFLPLFPDAPLPLLRFNAGETPGQAGQYGKAGLKKTAESVIMDLGRKTDLPDGSAYRQPVGRGASAVVDLNGKKGNGIMEYRINEPVGPEALSSLREAVGWNRMERELNDPRMSSFCHIAAWEGERLAGYIDCVSNRVTDAYIQDLMVHPEYQGRGIGTGLMERMIAYLKRERIHMISVIFEESLRPFYKRFGFYTMLSGQLETYESR